MAIILCPGIHDPALTSSFWEAIQSVKVTSVKVSEPSMAELPHPYIFPEARYWAFSPSHVLQFLHRSLPITQPLVFLGFSAGVVGAIGAAWAWQQQGGTVRALVAVDGWGVPLYGTFPIYRLSHDGFTHWSSQGLGMGREPFYADPGVPHLELWRSPDRAWGWWQQGQQQQRTNAAAVIRHLLWRHC